MITWNIDLEKYTLSQIEDLTLAVENIDYDIYLELANYLIKKRYWTWA
jgi:hypothetical protein